MRGLGMRRGRFRNAGFLWMAMGAVAVAQPPGPAPAPEASAAAAAVGRLEQVAGAYRRLGAYDDRGEVVMSYRQGDAPRSIRLPVSLGYVRPDRLLWDAKVTCLVGNRDRV